ncbi:MAG: FAD-dependent oxidoreductase [Chloroflexi bacterium]|nr:FAD-dependent oxidoreductase [Chloroflexota bacterium]
MSTLPAEKNSPREILVLGGGPAGLAAGWALENLGRDYRILEKSTVHGGNARTVQFGEFRYDTGPHRFHARDPQATQRLMELLGDDLLEVQAPSRIYWQGKFIDFPLRPMQILMSGGLAYAARAGADFVAARLQNRGGVVAEDFATFAKARFGKTIANTFLIPFSEKLWGLPASELSPDIAGRRLPGFSIKGMARELLSGSKKVEHLEGRFLYPRMGYGQIADQMAERLTASRLLYKHRVASIDTHGNEITGVGVKVGDEIQRFSAEAVINTLPITTLVGMMNPLPPKEVLNAAAKLRFRDVVLVALFLDQETISDAAVTYFQVGNLDFTRAHEPRNRSRSMSPPGQTSIVVEYPCFIGDAVWARDEERLVSELVQYLENMGLIDAAKLIGADVHRLTNAYPVYAKGYEQISEVILSYLRQFDNLWSLGRGGSFFYGHVHDFINDGFSAADAADAYLL